MRGYLAADLADPWVRYLAPLPESQDAVTSVTPVTAEALLCALCEVGLTPANDGGNGLCGACDAFGQREAVAR